MLLCILTGGNVDLSVGSTVCVVGVAAAQMLACGLPALAVIPVCLILSVLIGAIQGYLIGYLHIPPFICTLAGMFLLRGLGRMILDSRTVTIHNKTFLDIFSSYISVPGLDSGDTKWSSVMLGCIVSLVFILYMAKSRSKRQRNELKQHTAAYDLVRTVVIVVLIMIYTWQLAHYRGISVMALWVIVVIIIYNFITSRTSLGRYFYAVGGNEKAAKLSGINTKKVYFLAYTSMSLLAGLSALIVAARVGSVSGDTGNSFEMDAIAACFIGGASPYGGVGTVSGIVIGAILLGVINQGMSIIGLDSNFQFIVKGAVLLAAVVFDVVSNRRSS
jgi:putative multiple sugar transport system permease protein